MKINLNNEVVSFLKALDEVNVVEKRDMITIKYIVISVFKKVIKAH